MMTGYTVLIGFWQQQLRQYKLFLFSLFLIIFFTLTLYACSDPTNTSSIAQPINNNPVQAVPAHLHDGLIVKFKTKINDSEQRANFLSRYGLIERQANISELVPGLSRVVIAANTSAQDVIRQLASESQRQSSPIEFADYNYFVYRTQIPNDPDFTTQQWSLNNTGQTGGQVDADIDAAEAWDIQAANGEVVVAIIDSGIDYLHPDLRDQIWLNPNEIPNNNIDDDGNGYIDDIRGWNFVDANNNPMDDNNHGTHVAGVIAASSNNAIGISGIASMKHNVKLMPLKFMGPSGGGTIVNAIEALEYAVNMGAKISNNSWGGEFNSQALYLAIQAARDKGHLFIASAGNNTQNNDL
ncbi:MAG: S8 family serine peptidase, partial [Gammaproteobacteria bacterium]|nr:S8 family serine peptidase [Gammaproteobacteria bacterium]